MNLKLIQIIPTHMAVDMILVYMNQFRVHAISAQVATYEQQCQMTNQKPHLEQ